MVVVFVAPSPLRDGVIAPPHPRAYKSDTAILMLNEVENATACVQIGHSNSHAQRGCKRNAAEAFSPFPMFHLAAAAIPCPGAPSPSLPRTM
eukprot:354917-Chlamydomonas_euryale.AAC.4